MFIHHDDECTDKEKSNVPDGLAQRLFKTRTVLIAGQIDQEIAEKTIAQLLALDADAKDPIKVFITSQGGHVDSGYAIHDIMRYVESPIICIGAGWVASIAVPILFGAKKPNRFALPNTRFLLHQPSGGAGGHLPDIRIEAQEILKIRGRINKLIADECGLSVEKVASDSDRNFWMTAEEALEYGIISKVISRSTDITG